MPTATTDTINVPFFHSVCMFIWLTLIFRVLRMRHAIHYLSTTFSFLYGAFSPDFHCLFFIHLLKLLLFPAENNQYSFGEFGFWESHFVNGFKYIQLTEQFKNKWEYWHYATKQIPIFRYLERNQYLPSIQFSNFSLLFNAFFDANLNLDLFSTSWCSSAQSLTHSLNKDTENRLKIFSQHSRNIFSKIKTEKNKE